MSTTPDSSARYELKFLALETVLPEVRHWIGLQPEGFAMRYPDRWVNSIYFDTASLHAYAQNLAGGSDRQKVRYRWYGDLDPVRGGQLEVKVRRNRLGWKLVYPVRNPDTPIIESHELIDWLREEAPDASTRWLTHYAFPTSITRYFRSYYATPGDTVRMTLDASLQLLDQRLARRLNLKRRLPSPGVVVVEVKFDREHEQEARAIVERLPIRASRFSKYVSSVSRAGVI